MSDDVQWLDPGAPGVPYVGTYRGREGVAEFFRRMSETSETVRFEPREYVEQGDRVAAFGAYETRSRQTGRTASTDWAMSFRIANGKVTNFQAFTDTTALAAAFRQDAAAARR